MFVERARDHIGKDVLVFGASNTVLIERLLRLKANVTVIDIRLSAFEKFRGYGNRLTLQLVTEHCEFRELSQCFDTIIFYDTLHHIHNNRKHEKLGECEEHLLPGGALLLYEPNLSTRWLRERDQFGEIKQSMYKTSLLRLLRQHEFTCELMVIAHRSTWYQWFKIVMQRLPIDPFFRITVFCRKPNLEIATPPSSDSPQLMLGR